MGMCQWISENVILTIALILVTFVGLTGFVLFVDGIYIVASFSSYIGHFEGAGRTYYLFGVPIILLGLTVVVVAFIGCCAAATSVNCLLIYLLASMWYFAVLEGLVAGLALSTANMRVTINGAVCTGFYDCLAQEVDMIFHRDYKFPSPSYRADLGLDGVDAPGKQHAPGSPLARSPPKECDQEALELGAGREAARTPARDARAQRTAPSARTAAPTSASFNAMQVDLECCGSDGPDDYAKLGLLLPASCCKAELVAVTCPLRHANHRGCKKVLVLWMRTSVQTLGIIAAICCAITIAASIVACLLMVMICGRD